MSFGNENIQFGCYLITKRGHFRSLRRQFAMLSWYFPSVPTSFVCPITTKPIPFFSAYSVMVDGANDDFRTTCLMGFFNSFILDSIFFSSDSMNFFSCSNSRFFSCFLKKDSMDWLSMHVNNVIWDCPFYQFYCGLSPHLAPSVAL